MMARRALIILSVLIASCVNAQERIDRLDSLFGEYRLYHLKDSPFGIPEISSDSSMVDLYPVHLYDNIKPSLHVATYGGPSIDLTRAYVRNNGIAATISHPVNRLGRYFITRKPITTLGLRIGTGGEQNFELFHSQNINRSWNASAGFNRINQEGFYENQRIVHDKLWLSSTYTANSGVYQVFLDVNYQNRSMGQNGGITSDSTFKDNLLEDKGLLSVESSEAASLERRWWVGFRQYLNIGVRRDTSGQYLGLKGGRFEHDISWQWGKRTFHEPSPSLDIYPQILYSNDLTRDSVSQRIISNRIGWRGIHVDGLSYYLGSGHDWRRYGFSPSDTTGDFDTTSSAYFVTFELDARSKKVSFTAKGRYNMVGYNEKGFNLNTAVRIDSIPFVLDRFRLHANAQNSLWDPTYYRYGSNHYEWDMDWEQTFEAEVGGLLTSTEKGIKIAATYNLFDGWYYFDQTARPKKWDGVINALTVNARVPVTLGQFELSAEGWYHSTDADVMPVPDWVVSGELLWKKKLFKGRMDTRLGLDVTWFASYSGWAYSPVSGQFYLQAERSIGDYPYIDFFIDGKIKEVRFFLKLSHLNSGLTGDNYFGALHYPMPDRAIKFGVTWPFLN